MERKMLSKRFDARRLRRAARSQRGTAVIIAVFVVGLLAMFVAASLSRVTNESLIMGNDQFNTDGTTVMIKSANGSMTPLLVPSIRTNANSPRIPLTIAMMKDPTSDYFAQISPASGRITNANNLFLNTAGVPTGVAG